MDAWRELAIPHRDVLKGTFKQSEFAADLTQVVRGTATPEYSNAQEFYRRTFITEGMSLLLRSVVQRLLGKGKKTITVTKNEVLTALNQKEKFILAVVIVDGDQYEEPYYIKQPFDRELSGIETSTNVEINKLLQRAE